MTLLCQNLLILVDYLGHFNWLFGDPDREVVANMTEAVPLLSVAVFASGLPLILFQTSPRRVWASVDGINRTMSRYMRSWTLDNL